MALELTILYGSYELSTFASVNEHDHLPTGIPLDTCSDKETVRDEGPYEVYYVENAR